MNEIQPPVLPLPTPQHNTGQHTSGPFGGPQDDRPSGGSARSTLDQGFATLKRSPLHRNSTKGVIGGVCAGIAESTGLSVAAVRVAAVVLALFFGTGVGAYLLGWALLPDEGGRTHAEQALREGRGSSLFVLVLGGIALFGAVAWIFDAWPLLIAAAVVAFVVAKKKGHFTGHHTHG